MPRIAIVTDSTAYLPAELVERHAIHVIPLYVHLEQECFRDGVDLTPAAFFERLAGAGDLPKTSQPSSGDFIDLYQQLATEAEAIISIHISSGLSGTVDSALAARQQLAARTANNGSRPVEIHVVDSLLTGGAQALLVTEAVRLRDAGRPAAEIVQRLQELRDRLPLIFVVDTLEYLHKGGRIGGAAAVLGSLIQMKPILHLEKGRIELLEKVRLAKKAKRRLLEIVAERAGDDQPLHIAVMHANAPDEAELLKQQVAEQFQCAELFVCELSPVIASHVGPGTVALAVHS